MSSEEQNFTGLRSLLWPVHSFETRKLLPLLILHLLTNFNYSILRNLKDTVLVMAKGSGAEAIPFVKVWTLLPMAILFTFVYSRLINRYTREKVFYLFVGAFVGYFLLFGFVIYPNLEIFRPVGFVENLRSILPSGAMGFLAMVSNWPCALFYSICELWTAMISAVLIWGLTNDITNVPQAKRFYGVLNLASAVSSFFAGQVSLWVTKGVYDKCLFYGQNAWQQNFLHLLFVITASSFVMLMCMRFLEKKVIYDPKLCDQRDQKLFTGKRKKKVFSLRETFSHLKKSKYLAYLAFIVVAYNLCINLTELVWKARLKELYPLPTEFNNYLNFHISMMGVVAAIFAIFIPKIISKLGWTVLALMTPIILASFSSIFFGVQLFSLPWMSEMLQIFGMNTLAFVVMLGSRNNMFSKAAKYSLFDASKEMAYIPLPEQVRLTGKAAIDGIGSRMGKSGSSLIQQGLLMYFGTVILCVPWITAILAIVITAWIVCVLRLGKDFDALSVKQGEK